MREKRSTEELQMGWWSQNNNPDTPPPPPPPPLKHNHTIKALLPFLHCLISAGYLRYLCGCSYLWPSACCFVVTPFYTRTLHPPTCSHPPTPVCCDLQRGVITPWPIWRSPHVECAYAESPWIGTVWGEVKYLQKYDLTRFIKWGKMKTKQLLVLS